jgi:hypothetical protein
MSATVATVATVARVAAVKTANALVAIKGNKAEDILCIQPSVKAGLEAYFGKPIRAITKIASRKKSDNLIEFTDGTKVPIQNKDGPCTGRGHSIDRRKISSLTDDTYLHSLLERVCLKKPEVLTAPVPKATSELCVSLCLLGTDAETRPQYFLHTLLNEDSTAITHLSIVKASVFLDRIKADLIPDMETKRTCVHLSPNLYFQRKGGGASDHSPDDVQTKIQFNPKPSRAIPTPTNLFSLFTPVPL